MLLACYGQFRMFFRAMEVIIAECIPRLFLGVCDTSTTSIPLVVIRKRSGTARSDAVETHVSRGKRILQVVLSKCFHCQGRFECLDKFNTVLACGCHGCLERLEMTRSP